MEIYEKEIKRREASQENKDSQFGDFLVILGAGSLIASIIIGLVKWISPGN